MKRGQDFPAGRGGRRSSARWLRTERAPRRTLAGKAELELHNQCAILAALYGIQPSFVDASGREQTASLESLQALLSIFGAGADSLSEIRSSLHKRRLELAEQIVEPVTVLWDGRAKVLPIHAPKGSSRRRAALLLEDGSKSIDCSVRHGLKRVSAERPESEEIFLPNGVPPGYHTLELTLGRRTRRALVISAPSRCYSNPELAGGWGIFAPVYAMHSQRSLGVGDFGAWGAFVDWALVQGAKFIGTLPLTAAFLDSPFEPSPYSPASRLFWNEVFIDLETIPEFDPSLLEQPKVRKAIADLRAAPLVDYKKAMALKRALLEPLSAQIVSSPRTQDFEQFVRSKPLLREYARFRAACEAQQRSWHVWPAPMKSGSLKPGDYSKRAQRFHECAQWIAQQQIGALLERVANQGAGLYLDLPLGVNPDSFDCWKEQKLFALQASVGAPPDPFFTLGQNWGFPPMFPDRLRETHYAHLLECLRFQMAHARVLRIDHVMGLHRLFWAPHHASPGSGAYVRYPAEELYALLSLESHRHKTVLIGENLGTVPPEVNKGLDRHGIRKMWVFQFETRADERAALTQIPRHVMASLNTHDMPTFQSFLTGKDADERRKLGLITAAEAYRGKSGRKRLVRALVRFFARRELGLRKRSRGSKSAGTSRLRALLRAALLFMARSPAEFMLVNLEDLWLESKPQNVPGTSVERPNWKRKMRRSLEGITRSRALNLMLSEIHQARALRRKP